MQARFITAQQLQAAAIATGVTLDMRSLNDKGDRHQVKVNPTKPNHYQRISYSERKVHAVCWHGFRDFFRACYELAPTAVFRTAMDTWKGSEDFEARFPASGHQNIGSAFQPMTAAEACTCPDSGYAG